MSNIEADAKAPAWVRTVLVASLIVELLTVLPCRAQQAGRKRDRFWNPAGGAPEIIRRARSEYEKQNYERALKLYQEALETVPEQYLSGFGAANIHFDIGACYTQLGRYEEAVAAIQKSNSFYPDPDYLPAHCAYLGMVYSRMEHYAKAEQYWQKAAERDPTQPIYFAGLANNCVRLGHYDKAQEAINRGLKVATAPEAPDYFKEAQLIVHLAKGNYVEAHRIAGDAKMLGARFIDSRSGAVQINFIFQGGPAQLAGLAAGDIIESINGKPARNVNEFFIALEAVPFASTVEIRLKRDSASHVRRVVAGVPANLPELAAAVAFNSSSKQTP